jgi:hypothetical protein
MIPAPAMARTWVGFIMVERAAHQKIGRNKAGQSELYIMKLISRLRFPVNIIWNDGNFNLAEA